MTTPAKMAYEEKKQRGEAIYEAEIRQHIGPEDEKKYVMIDVLSGDYEVGENTIPPGAGCGRAGRTLSSTRCTTTRRGLSRRSAPASSSTARRRRSNALRCRQRNWQCDGGDGMTTLDKMTYEEQKRRGEAIYAAQIRHQISPEDANKYVQIDVISGDYELHENSITAGRRLRARRPDAVIHTMYNHRTPVVKALSPRIVGRSAKAVE